METLYSYSGEFSTQNEVCRPQSYDELVALLAEAETPVTLRASGGSLHTQALSPHGGTTIVLSDLPHRVVVTVDDPLRAGLTWHTVEATAWTPWDAIVRATLRLEPPERWEPGTWNMEGPASSQRNRAGWSIKSQLRLLPYVLASSGRITVGGTLSGDTMWRFSSCFGKEADSVVWMDILLYRAVDGEPRKPFVRRLFQPRAGLWTAQPVHAPNDLMGQVEHAATQEENDAQFYGVIGGFGLLGPVIRAKYVLLELDPSITEDVFEHAKPKAASEVPWDGDDTLHPFVVGALEALHEAEASQKSRDWGPPPWPSYPHTAKDDLGHLGDGLDAKALTWMWETKGGLPLLSTLIEHRMAQAKRYEDVEGFRLPRKVDGKTVACFGLFFPDGGDMRGVIGNVGFGEPTSRRRRFGMWDRDYAYERYGMVMEGLPCMAHYGSWFVWRSLFKPCIDATEDGEAHANPIPEFAFFLGGHWAGCHEQSRPPRSLQQSWVFSLDEDGTGAAAVTKFLADVQKMCTDRRPVHVQVCDLKCVPSSGACLGSSSGPLSIVVTLGIEDGRGYDEKGPCRFGKPKERLRRLATEHAKHAKIHLTKNVYVEPEVLKEMYGPQVEAFLALKSDMDPDGLYDSQFLQMLSQ